MLRILSKPFTRGRQDGLKGPLSTWHDPTVVPSAPILNASRPLTYPLRVHWWAADANCTSAPAAQTPPNHFHPSISISHISLRSDDIPWIDTGASSIWPDQSSPIPIQASRANVCATASTTNMLRSLSGARPLLRVLTITRMEGESIRRRRRIQKRVTPEELVVGLGLMLCDRARPTATRVQGKVARHVKEEEEHTEETWEVVRTLTEEIEDMEAEDW
ncbi:hypothetical protein DXG01_006426 [Tephrocybe rancida]|nr:hypothetical protein DXG01_006426 [Tephrocybe rancida]